jgi:hypothetical protein
VLGRRYLDFVVGDLKSHLSAAFECASHATARRRSVWIFSECNTPHLFRPLATRISALCSKRKSPSGEAVNASTLDERYQLVMRREDDWRDVRGLIVQCSCCRRVKNPHTALSEMSVELLDKLGAEYVARTL